MLTPQQWQFVSLRLLCKTDLEAAKKLGLSASQINNWRRHDEAFKAVMLQMHSETMQMVKDMIAAHTGVAAQKVIEALDAEDSIGKPDWTTRLKAAEMLLKASQVVGISKVQVGGDPDNPIQVNITADDLHEALRKARQEQRAEAELQQLADPPIEGEARVLDG